MLVQVKGRRSRGPQRVSLYVKQVTLSTGKCQAMCAERNNVLSSKLTLHLTKKKSLD